MTDDLDPNFDLILEEDLSKNEYPKQLDEHKKEEKQSIMAQVMTRDLFDQLKDQQTSSGWTIARAINTGVLYPSSFLGCHAGDKESYSLFSSFFHPVIEKYHRLEISNITNVTDMDPDKLTTDLSDSAKAKVISTRIRCARNIAAFPMNTVGTKESRLKIADVMESVFGTFEAEDFVGDFYRHTTMTPEQTQKLVDDHFLFRGKDKMQAASGYHQYWPEGRGIFTSTNKNLIVWVNEGDHLRIISMESGNNVKGVLDRLNRGVAAIEKKLQEELNETEVFVSDDKLGMITCCPTNLGSGMRCSVHMMVPGVIESIGFEKLDQIARGMNCQVRGSSGEHSQVVDRVDVSNWRRLGVPEYELVQDMIKCANHIAELEDQSQNNHIDELEDQSQNNHIAELEDQANNHIAELEDQANNQGRKSSKTCQVL